MRRTFSFVFVLSSCVLLGSSGRLPADDNCLDCKNSPDGSGICVAVSDGWSNCKQVEGPNGSIRCKASGDVCPPVGGGYCYDDDCPPPDY